jgi:tRNA nucleotidyltransferase (CCA-adding enzyme)
MQESYQDYFKNVPKNVKLVAAALKHSGFKAFLVGGCVRDHIMGFVPSDYDITTDATPEQIIAIFPRTFYENEYGTVGVVTVSEQEENEIKLKIENELKTLNLDSEEINLKIKQEVKKSIVEVTPFRIEADYEDNRHPSKISWGQDINQDLKRRDFTCNAIAYDVIDDILIDEFDGIKDIRDKILKCVENPNNRFKEDALRLIRLARFSAQLGFKIESVTREKAIEYSSSLKNISCERIRDELCKMLNLKNPKEAIEICKDLKILKHILPELENGIGVKQNQAHFYDVWEHNLRTLQHAADKGWDLNLRLAALLHDISKPETRRFSREKGDYTFYGHDVVGGRVSREILERLKFPRNVIDYVSSLVRWHMFFSDTEQITLSAVRRIIVNVGKDRIWDLMNLRICDRIGTGRPKEQPYRFRAYQSMIEQALTDPISLKQLKIDGKRIMEVTQETPGPKVGMILNALFSEVLEDSSKNNTEHLEQRALHMKRLSIKELALLSDQGKEDMSKQNEQKIKDIKDKFRVSK